MFGRSDRPPIARGSCQAEIRSNAAERNMVVPCPLRRCQRHDHDAGRPDLRVGRKQALERGREVRGVTAGREAEFDLHDD